MGACLGGVRLDGAKTHLRIGGKLAFAKGVPADTPEAELAAVMIAPTDWIASTTTAAVTSVLPNRRNAEIANIRTTIQIAASSAPRQIPASQSISRPSSTP